MDTVTLQWGIKRLTMSTEVVKFFHVLFVSFFFVLLACDHVSWWIKIINIGPSSGCVGVYISHALGALTQKPVVFVK